MVKAKQLSGAIHSFGWLYSLISDRWLGQLGGLMRVVARYQYWYSTRPDSYASFARLCACLFSVSLRLCTRLLQASNIIP
jgi:hypothetical protein